MRRRMTPFTVGLDQRSVLVSKQNRVLQAESLLRPPQMSSQKTYH